MKKINIVTDCTSDLSSELIEKNNITVIPLYVNFDEESYRDGIDITTEQIYEKVKEYNQLPKSATISPAVYHDYFSSFPKDEDVIYIGIGSGFSGSFQNAVLASEEFDNVYVVDSQNLSSGIGLLLLKMCKFRDEGQPTVQIIKNINRIIPQVRTQFAINTLDYLHMGGRCSGTSRIFGTLLKIKPIIRVIDNKMEVAKKPHGKYIKALNVLLDYIDNDKERLDKDNIMVTHSLADDDAVYLIKELKERFPGTNIVETRASGVISTHCGPRTIGILYIVEYEK